MRQRARSLQIDYSSVAPFPLQPRIHVAGFSIQSAEMSSVFKDIGNHLSKAVTESTMAVTFGSNRFGS
jgi:hypothetical protein